MDDEETLRNIEKLLIKTIFEMKDYFKDLFIDLGMLYIFLNKFNENLYNIGIKFALKTILNNNIVLNSEDIEGLTIIITPDNYEIVINYLPIRN